MKEEQKEITKKDIVFIIGLAIFAFLTFIGIKFVWYDIVVSVLITALCLGLLILFVVGLKKIKTVETKFKTWKIVEIFSLLLFVLLLLLFINIPMNRTLKAFSERDNLKEQAVKELNNIENALNNYIEQEMDVINTTINSLRSVIDYSTNSGFDSKSKMYIEFFVNKGYSGMIKKNNVNEYEDLLQAIFINDHDNYFDTIREITTEMKQQGWGILDLCNILDYSEKIDKLYKEVESELTSFSRTHHAEKGYPYKFVIKYDDIQNKYIVDNKEKTEFEYDIPNDIDYNMEPKQSDFMTEVEIITWADNFSILSIIINIMVLFPYLMANRSTKVEIRKAYKKNNKDFGGRDL